jgi:hypothetical protein
MGGKFLEAGQGFMTHRVNLGLISFGMSWQAVQTTSANTNRRLTVCGNFTANLPHIGKTESWGNVSTESGLPRRWSVVFIFSEDSPT